MKTENEFPSNSSRESHDSWSGEVYIPISVATIPPALFMLLGFITKGMDKAVAEPSLFVIVAMMAVQTLGMVAMAFVILVRHERASKELSVSAEGNPHALRKMILLLSITCLLLFDILTNVAAAVAGAGPLLVAAVPVFAAYLFFNRVAFAGLSRNRLR